MLGYVEEWDCSQILQVLFFVVPKRLTKLLLTCYLLKKNITVNQILDLLDCRILFPSSYAAKLDIIFLCI